MNTRRTRIALEPTEQAWVAHIATALMRVAGSHPDMAQAQKLLPTAANIKKKTTKGTRVVLFTKKEQALLVSLGSHRLSELTDPLSEEAFAIASLLQKMSESK